MSPEAARGHDSALSQQPAAPARGAVVPDRLLNGDRLLAVRATQLLDTPAEALFDHLAELAARLTGLPLAFMTLVDERRSYWKATIGTGIAGDDTTSRQNTVEESFCQYVIATDGPVVVEDAAADELTRDNPSVEAMGVRAWAGFPVRSPDGHVLGSFCVVDTVPRTFDADQLLLVEALADSASRELALRAALAASREALLQHQQRADDLDREQRRQRRQERELAANLHRLQSLNAAAVAMQQLDDVDAVLQAATEHAAAIVGARQAVASVTRNDDWAQAITAVVLDGAYAAWADCDAVADGSGIYAMVCQTNTPVRLTQAELEAHPRWRGFGEQAAAHPPMRGWLAAPLVARDGSNLGLVQLSDKVSDPAGGSEEFDEADLAVLVQLAQLASLAVEKALAHQLDHHIAVELQRSLLPLSLPDLPGVSAAARYLPGSGDQMVGGDWYDIWQLRDGWIGLALGDVVGHGLRSASVMGQLRTGLRAYALEEQDPAVVVDRLDRLLGSLGTGDMATLAYVSLHPATGQLRLVLAGHPHPYVRHADGSVRPLEAEPGLPLGAFPGTGYTESRAVLPVGSTLLLFSDGLLETRLRSVGEGLAELEQVLGDPMTGLEPLLDHVVESLTRGRNDDDIAVLALKTLDAAADAGSAGS
jgi:serine phosphatase RsbU (regulator of sigma subunit)